MTFHRAVCYVVRPTAKHASTKKVGDCSRLPSARVTIVMPLLMMSMDTLVDTFVDPVKAFGQPQKVVSRQSDGTVRA